MNLTQSNNPNHQQPKSIVHYLHQLKDESWLVYFDPQLKGYVFAKKSTLQTLPKYSKKGGEL